MENNCDNCDKNSKIIFDFKKQSFGDKIIPAGKFCSNKCIAEHITKYTK